MNDHLLAHFDYYVRKWHLILYQFVVLPLLILAYVKQQALMSKFGIMETMSSATIIILNLGFGTCCCLVVTLWLHRRGKINLAIHPENTKRDLRYEAKIDYLGLTVHTLLMLLGLYLFQRL